MKIFFPVLILMSLAISGCKDTDPPELVSPKPLISIDCTESGLGDLSAGFVLDWIADLTEENGGTVLVELRGEKRGIEFLFHTKGWKHGVVEIDMMAVDFRKEGIFVNEVLLSVEDFDSRLGLYMEAVKLVESDPFIVPTSSNLIPMKECMGNFDRIYEHGFRRIFLPGKGSLIESISGQTKSRSGGGNEP